MMDTKTDEHVLERLGKYKELFDQILLNDQLSRQYQRIGLSVTDHAYKVHAPKVVLPRGVGTLPRSDADLVFDQTVNQVVQSSRAVCDMDKAHVDGLAAYAEQFDRIQAALDRYSRRDELFDRHDGFYKGVAVGALCQDVRQLAMEMHHLASLKQPDATRVAYLNHACFLFGLEGVLVELYLADRTTLRVHVASQRPEGERAAVPDELLRDYIAPVAIRHALATEFPTLLESHPALTDFPGIVHDAPAGLTLESLTSPYAYPDAAAACFARLVYDEVEVALDGVDDIYAKCDHSEAGAERVGARLSLLLGKSVCRRALSGECSGRMASLVVAAGPVVAKAVARAVHSAAFSFSEARQLTGFRAAYWITGALPRK